MSESQFLPQTPGNATNPGAAVMETQPTVGRTHNKFNLSHQNYLTARYGDVTPFFAFDGVEQDSVPFSSQHEIRSYTMQAPLMSTLKLNKDYFSVPIPALLRKNYDDIYKTPARGSDVPLLARLSLPMSAVGDHSLMYYVSEFAKKVGGQIKGVTDVSANVLVSIVRYVHFLESILSPGSLLNVLGCHAHTCCRFDMSYNGRVTHDCCFDDALEIFYAELSKFTMKLSVSYGGNTKLYCYVGTADNAVEQVTGSIKVSFSRFMSLVRDNVLSSFTVLYPVGVGTFPMTELVPLSDALVSVVDNGQPFNYTFLVAYQAVCAQFYTNDKVDNLYTWQLYEQSARSLLINAGITEDTESWVFDYNGDLREYDTFSGSFVKWALAKVLASATLSGMSGVTLMPYAYLNYLFGFRHSLRFADYFNGSRTSPLAVGDVDAPVVGNKVSAVDTTKSILMQRFLSAVMKVGQRFQDFKKGIYGGNYMPDYHEPKFISHSVFTVGANEVDNTSENQGNVVQTLRSGADKYEFKVDLEVQSIIIGVCSFECPLVYARNAYKEFFKESREDVFNPFLQNIGDQEVLPQELNFARIDTTPFGFVGRHMEYKTKVSIASGGFVRNLPAWAFISDTNNSGIVSGTDDIVVIDEDFIRSNPSEFDRFYGYLTGRTLSSYFHFILRFDNDCQPVRPMEYNPSIL